MSDRRAFQTLYRLWDNKNYYSKALHKTNKLMESCKEEDFKDPFGNTVTCWRAMGENGQPRKLKEGYVQLAIVQPSGYANRNGNPYNKPSITAYAHQLVVAVAGDWDLDMIEGYLELTDEYDLCFSHLCHNSWCCNPKHIVLEPLWANIRRKCCGYNKAQKCECHIGWKGNEGGFSTCLLASR
jgi:hypothetical protein